MSVRRLIALAPLGVVTGLLLAAPVGARSLPILKPQAVSHASGGAPVVATDVVLPSRVAAAIQRASNLLDAAGTAIDTADSAKAVTSLKGMQTAVLRADKAARRQMSVVPVTEGATPGPDSVIAALTLDQTIVTTLAGLFDTKSGATVDALTHTLFATLNLRAALVNAVIALPAEGAGADYADAMPDTAAGYDDEVANLVEALSDDTLSAGGKKVLRTALAQSHVTQTRFNAAFGGGE
jgi:hypothetical protein